MFSAFGKRGRVRYLRWVIVLVMIHLFEIRPLAPRPPAIYLRVVKGLIAALDHRGSDLRINPIHLDAIHLVMGLAASLGTMLLRARLLEDVQKDTDEASAKHWMVVRLRPVLISSEKLPILARSQRTGCFGNFKNKRRVLRRAGFRAGCPVVPMLPRTFSQTLEVGLHADCWLMRFIISLQFRHPMAVHFAYSVYHNIYFYVHKKWS